MIEQNKITSVVSGSGNRIVVRNLGLRDYQQTWREMIDFTDARNTEADDFEISDEIWFVQHPAVYTQGTACSSTTLIPSTIPIVKTDRGGQITYHGEGQLVMYVLLELKHFKLTVSKLVRLLEQAVIDFLADQKIQAERKDKAPGVYVAGVKIAALGLRIRKGRSYHGLSLNVDMDLSPFANIDPCGFKGLEVTSMAKLGSVLDIKQVEEQFLGKVLDLL